MATPPGARTPEEDSAAAVLADLTFGFYFSRMLYTVAAAGIPDLLGNGPRTAEDLAEEAGLHGPSLARVLRTLAAKGVFASTDDGRFALNPVAELIRDGHPSAGRDLLLAGVGTMAWRAWERFPDVLRTGRTGVELAFEMPLFEYYRRNPDESTHFNRMMIANHFEETGAVATAYDFSRSHHIVDLGGGVGSLLAAVLAGAPQAHGTLFDRPDVIDESRETFARHGLSGRVDLVGGDFFEAVPAGADTYLMSHIIHDWDEGACGVILGNCARALGPGGRLLIVEMVLPAGDEFHPGKLFDMAMLTLPGGVERTADEYRDLLTRAGFDMTRVIPTSSAVSIVEAVVAGGPPADQ